MILKHTVSSVRISTLIRGGAFGALAILVACLGNTSGDGPQSGLGSSVRALGFLAGVSGYASAQDGCCEESDGFAWNLARGPNLQFHQPMMPEITSKMLRSPALAAYYNHYNGSDPHWKIALVDDYIQVVSGTQVIVKEPGQQDQTFNLSGSVWVAANLQDVDSLAKNGDSTWDLTKPHDDRTAGRFTTYHYSAAVSSKARLATIKNRMGTQLTLTRNGSGQLTSVSDGVRSYTFGWGASGLTSITDPTSAQATIGYNGSGQITSIAAAGDGAVAFTYNASGQLLTVTRPGAAAITVGYTGG
jgi:YD repeat-containing protein